MQTIDLRSDTVTTPDADMRRAMAEAPVGDDVFGEDPTVMKLERMSAEMLGMEAGLFVASGTMSNLVAILSHCQRGDEAIVGSEAHILHYEVASAAGLGGVQLRVVPNDAAGRISPDDVTAEIRGQDVHFPQTTLVCLENTQNRCGGTILTPEGTKAVADVAHERGVKVHIDGARIFNAAVALGIPASTLTADADSVGFCLSKGLGAPVGSVLCGRGEFIARARKNRKAVGGGMRQVGIIAAAGVYALENMVERLAEDHENARFLAQELAKIPGVRLDPSAVQTNIVIWEMEDISAPDFSKKLREQALLVTTLGPTRLRMVTHYGIERSHIEDALERLQRTVVVAA